MIIKMLKALFGSKKVAPVAAQLVAANDNVAIDWNDYVPEYQEEELVRDPYDGEMLTMQEFYHVYGHVTSCGCESVKIGSYGA